MLNAVYFVAVSAQAVRFCLENSSEEPGGLRRHRYKSSKVDGIGLAHYRYKLAVIERTLERPPRVHWPRVH